MQKKWTYQQYEIREGLKPGSKKFQYFFVVSKNDVKKSNYCVWITDDALSGFNDARDFDAIVEAHRENWGKWVKEKIDTRDFQNRALKFEKSGKTEINLSEIREHVKVE